MLILDFNIINYFCQALGSLKQVQILFNFWLPNVGVIWRYLMYKKLLSLFLVALLAMSGIGSACASVDHPVAIPAPQYREAPWHFEYPVGNEWPIEYERKGALVNYCEIYEVNNTAHKIDDVENGKQKIDSGFVGKSIVIHSSWGGTPSDTNVLVPYYPGGKIRLSHHFDSAAYRESWMDVTINNWVNWQCGRNANNALVEWSFPDDFKI
jgi:hypothetical protein